MPQKDKAFLIIITACLFIITILAMIGIYAQVHHLQRIKSISCRYSPVYDSTSYIAVPLSYSPCHRKVRFTERQYTSAVPMKRCRHQYRKCHDPYVPYYTSGSRTAYLYTSNTIPAASSMYNHAKKESVQRKEAEFTIEHLETVIIAPSRYQNVDISLVLLYNADNRTLRAELNRKKEIIRTAALAAITQYDRMHPESNDFTADIDRLVCRSVNRHLATGTIARTMIKSMRIKPHQYH